jgi:hypothetical protein
MPGRSWRLGRFSIWSRMAARLGPGRGLSQVDRGRAARGGFRLPVTLSALPDPMTTPDVSDTDDFQFRRVEEASPEPQFAPVKDDFLRADRGGNPRLQRLPAPAVSGGSPKAQETGLGRLADRLLIIAATFVALAIAAVATRYEVTPDATGGLWRLDRWTGNIVTCGGQGCREMAPQQFGVAEPTSPGGATPSPASDAPGPPGAEAQGRPSLLDSRGERRRDSPPSSSYPSGRRSSPMRSRPSRGELDQLY